MTVFNFPDTGGQPTDGTFQWTSPAGRVYIWDGNSWTSRGDGSGGGGDANITVTDNLGSISQPGQGDLAYHTVEARMYIYYEDDDSKQWVDASPGGDTIDNTPDAYVFMPTGGGDPKERVFYENEQVIDESYDITAGRNAMSAGPVTIADGVSIGVGAGQTWTVVGGADNSGGDGDSGLWTRSGTTVRPANSGDRISGDGELFLGETSDPRGYLKIINNSINNTDDAIRITDTNDNNVVEIKVDGSATFNGTFSAYNTGFRVNATDIFIGGSHMPFGGGSHNVRWSNTAGILSYDTVLRGTNAFIELDPDNSANYVSTTNADGKTETVYNGPTLDVKDSLQKILAALVAIKTASQVAGTLDDLKSAIATATADITDGGNN